MPLSVIIVLTFTQNTQRRQLSFFGLQKQKYPAVADAGFQSNSQLDKGFLVEFPALENTHLRHPLPYHLMVSG